MQSEGTQDLGSLLESARQGIKEYLDSARQQDRIDQQSYEQATRNTLPSLQQWLQDEPIRAISPGVREGLCKAISAERWEELVNAFRQWARFGTGGIRGMMAFGRQSIERLKEEGIGAPILRGPNTINDVVLLLTSAGVAKFGKEQQPPFDKVVIGYDSRIRGSDFAAVVAQLFLAYDYTVYFFDEPVPYPEMTFAIPSKDIKADLGILISASHNDYRYNGYKLSCSNGSQFDPKQRDEMYNKYIATATTEDIKLRPFEEAAKDKLIFLGGEQRVDGFDYLGREHLVLNIHEQHREHVKTFLLSEDLPRQEREAAEPLRIAYCAFHGAGRRAVPRLLGEVGFTDVKVITEGGLNDLDGLFPSFCSDPGREQQPDPGDPRAAHTAVEAFKRQYGSIDNFDILIGTDPDADRCGVVVKVPSDQQSLYGGQEWVLLPADEMWALLLWYRLHREIEKHGQVQDADKKFVVLSHTTSEGIILLARKHGLGVVKTWVGFAALAAAVRDVWEGKEIPPLVEGRERPSSSLCHPFVCECQGMDQTRSINVAAMEQSNGFSILGGPPPDQRSLGVGGHVRDKDGTMAALLVAEIAAWAKQQGTTLYELLDKHVHLDPDVGLFVTRYEPDPIDGEYPGIQGDRKKKNILVRALACHQRALEGGLAIAGLEVTSAAIYRTGKYDAIYQPTDDFQFPDEGVRFYFGSKLNHATVRPSGTGNSLRFHVQLHDPEPQANLVGKKRDLRAKAEAIVDHLREILEAPRS
jgi:phosphoglucomutase